jgi:transcriptional regulator with XRE-family HTH domain
MLVCMEPLQTLLTESLDSRGWSNTELAKRVGVSPATVGRWISGERTPSLSDAAQISRVLGIPLDHLAGLESPIPTASEREILRIVRVVGEDEARRRLVQAPVYATPVQPPGHNRGAG